MSPPPPPPPPPMCFPFTSKKQKPRRLSMSSVEDKYSGRPRRSADGPLVRNGSYSLTATLTSHAENLTFTSDSEAYDAVPILRDQKPKLIRSTIGRPPIKSIQIGISSKPLL